MFKVKFQLTLIIKSWASVNSLVRFNLSCAFVRSVIVSSVFIEFFHIVLSVALLPTIY